MMLPTGFCRFVHTPVGGLSPVTAPMQRLKARESILLTSGAEGVQRPQASSQGPVQHIECSEGVQGPRTAHMAQCGTLNVLKEFRGPRSAKASANVFPFLLVQSLPSPGIQGRV